MVPYHPLHAVSPLAAIASDLLIRLPGMRGQWPVGLSARMEHPLRWCRRS